MFLTEKVIFAQPRVGIEGKIFTIYKLHTMARGTDEKRDQLVELLGRDNFGHLQNDPRITPLGKYLRRYWIDEIPQIWNVLKGEMALVGARPLTQKDFESLPKELQD